MEEDIGKNIDNFEKILKTYCGSKSLLYRDKLINEKESQGLRPEDVIKNISKQIKVLNHNETLSKTVNNKLKTYKESRLTSINNMFSLELEPQQNHPNQWGFDTQLIVATKDAEAIKELHIGVTQEFETSFDQKPEIIYSQGKVNIDNKSCCKSALKINISSPHQILQDTVLNNCNLSNLGNKESNNDNAVDDCNLQDLVLECDTISSSPILFSKNEKECHNTSFLLESFEKFEAIAAPIVYENSDVEAVKKIINLKFLHNNQAQLTFEEIQYEDKNYETASIHLSPILKLKTDQEEIMRHINCHLSNKGDFLDEDIIFSSDEKTELDYNEVGELPLTCALQTSFYEQEYDLDKTIYVGFQTASNKSIQVLTNSFTKAKSILNDGYKISKPIQSLSLSELVEVYDSATMEKKGDYNAQKTSFDTGCGAKENAFNSSFHNNDKEHKPLDFGHFDDSVLLKKNKAVICTKEQIKIDDYMMQEFEENMSINDNKLHTNSDTVSKHPVIFNRADQLMLNDNTNAHSDYCSVPNSTSNNEQYKTILEEKLIENLGMDDKTMYQNNYERDKMNKNGNVKNELLTGFKTASNKCINISKASLVKSKEILEEVNIESNLTTDNLHAKMVKNKKFQGFRTASQKPIKISDKAYVESDKIFQSNQFPLVMNENQNLNNKKETTENTQNNSQIFEIENSKIDTPSGFKTASNNSIHVSKDALLISRKFLQEFNFDDDIVINNKKELVSEKETLRLITEGSYSDSNNPVSVSEEDFENTKNKLEEFRLKKYCEKDDKVGSMKEKNVKRKKSLQSSNDFSTFTDTSCLKNLSNTKRMLVVGVDQEIEDKLHNKESFAYAGLTTASDKRPKMTMESSIKSKNAIDNFTCELTNSINAFQGFKTANNKPVKISDEALEKSKKLFQDINNCDSMLFQSQNKEASNSNTLKDSFQGFMTASNNPVRISDEALENSKKIFQDINNCDSITPTSNSQQHSVSNTLKNTFQGFKIASNNPVKISDEALEKSKKIFQDINHCDSITPISNSEQHSVSNTLKNTFQGFKTASNNPVRISDEALEKSKKIFQGINDCDSYTPKSITKQTSVSNTLKNTFQSFKTASKNPVKISDEALEKRKKMFLDKNNCDSITSKTHSKKANVLNTLRNTCFKTTSNNPVRISDEAREKSKKIFQDVNDCDSITPTSNSEQHSVSNTLKNTFQGFKTASNNPVRISDEALEKSKKIFKDTNNYNDSDSVIFEANSKEASVLNTLKNTFQCFKTASNNPVQISDEALEKCKTYFQDIIVNSGHHLLENNSIEIASFNKIETANNNTLSKEDLRKSKTVFEETDSNLKTKIKQKLKDTYASMHTAPVETNINVHEYERNKEARKCFVKENKTTKTNITDVCNLLNTEVVNNFNETMLTEDFINKSPSNKRSGSPILSCPRPKKIKTKLVHEPVLEKSCEPIDKTNRFAFNANYKKQKKYKLLDVYEMDKVTNAIQSYKEVNYDIHNISSLEFVGARNELSDSKWTLDNITNFFLESVNKTIIPNGWVNNQIKLITLKLLSYEKRFPNSMQNVCSVSNVMEQLKYRYDRELYNVERPALRKILEKDEVPSRRMVLQVLNIYKNGSNVTDTSNSAENIELLLTDGWYCVKATLDKLLTKLVCEGKITIGMKLVTHGAELLHCEQGIAPWEDTSSVRLKISGNSTRRAHWAAKLGFHGNGAILSYLTTVKPEGGKISQLRVIATRVYPMLYVEKFDDGSTVTRSERLEILHQMKYEMERETMLEKIYEEVEKEFCMQASQCDSVDDDRKSLESGSQIYQLLKKSRDPAEFRAGLTYSQSKILQDYIDKRREISLQDLQSKVQSLLKKRGLNVTRNVVAMLKIRVADVYKQNVTKAVITVWRPHESLLHLLREGTWLDIHNVVPTAVRYSEIQISAGKQSVFRKTSKVDDKMLNIARTFQRKCYLIQELTQNLYLTTDYNEVDTVGFVFDVEPSVKEFDCKKDLFQNVFLADANKKIICTNFWGGLKKFGFDSILETGQVVACINLQKRSGNTRKNIPHYRATEFTYFTKTPKIDVCRKACEDLSKQFLSLDRRKFVQDCIILRNNLVNIKYGNIENISPYRFNNSDYNMSKNKIFINSPNGDPNLNLNGLDFDSTFQQSETLSPKALLRKKEVNERIARLRKYGEPPPLGPIHIVNKSRDAIKPYRSPLISKAESNKLPKSDQLVAVKPQTASTSAVDDHGDENTNENRCTSPVLPSKRTVNPVRLNFSKQKNGSKDDPFGEDFETSPPLSLD